MGPPSESAAEPEEGDWNQQCEDDALRSMRFEFRTCCLCDRFLDIIDPQSNSCCDGQLDPNAYEGQQSGLALSSVPGLAERRPLRGVTRLSMFCVYDSEHRNRMLVWGRA